MNRSQLNAQIEKLRLEREAELKKDKPNWARILEIVAEIALLLAKKLFK